MKALIDAVLARPTAVLLVLLLLVFTGAASYMSLPRESAPDVKIPIIYISIAMEGISPEDGERLLARPVEKKLTAVEGVKRMTSKSVEGFTNVMLEFQAGFDSEKAIRQVREKVDEAKAELPEDAEEPTVTEVNFSMFPIVNVILTGEAEERVMVAVARRLRDSIEALPGVLDADLAGAREEVVDIIVKPSVLESHNISPAAVLQQVQGNNVLVAAGALDTAQGRFAIKVPGLVEGLKELMEMPVKVEGEAVITLGQIAEIRRTFKDAKSYARVNGKPAIVLEVKKRVGANLIDTVARVREVVAQQQAYWPGSIEVVFSQDTSNEIKDMVMDLQNGIILAVLLVMLLVVFTMGWRSALLVAAAIPGSFLMTFVWLGGIDTTLNIVVLFSLILVVGMVVDDAIIVCEYADRKMVEGMSRREAYPEASKRMFWPVVGSTITPVIVFMPLMYWPGVVGQFMKYMPITVITALLASFLMAIFFIPTLGRFIGGIGNPSEEERQAMLASESGGSLEDLKPIPAAYARFVRRTLNRPGRFVAGLFGLMVVVYVAYGFLGAGVEFFPEVEPENAIVQVRARGNLSTLQKDAIVQQVEQRMAGMEEVKVAYARSGNLGQQEFSEDTIGIIRTEFVHWDERRKADDILAEIKARTADIPGIIVETRKQEGGPSQGKPIQIDFRSQYPDVLVAEFGKFMEAAHAMEGFRDIEDNRPIPGIQWEIRVDREKVARFGSSIAEVGSMIRLVTNGMKVGDYRPDDADDEVDLMVRFPEEDRTLEQLDRLRVYGKDGGVPIAAFINRAAQPEVSTIDRSGGMRVLTFQADVQEGELPDNLVQKLRAYFEQNMPDPRVMVSFRGEDEEQREAGTFLRNAFLLALAGMFLTFTIQFGRLFSAVVIMSAVFFSTVGVLLGLMLTGQPFGIVMCGIGIIALAGIVVKNNIIFIDTFDHLREEGFDYKEALIRTGLQRMRPILLTAASGVLGLLPMVFGLNINFVERDVSVGAPSSQWWTQLSASISGGLAFATILTLFCTPAIMMAWHNRQLRKAEGRPGFIRRTLWRWRR